LLKWNPARILDRQRIVVAVGQWEQSEVEQLTLRTYDVAALAGNLRQQTAIFWQVLRVQI
jgi:predicted pyridoxine 5'-phosphate oxidase superfamily flavin-nucleotide-binding protein